MRTFIYVSSHYYTLAQGALGSFFSPLRAGQGRGARNTERVPAGEGRPSGDSPRAGMYSSKACFTTLLLQ